jgi:hypothetical protein
MENIGFFRFFGAAAKFNINESNSLQNDFKVMGDWGDVKAAATAGPVRLTFRNLRVNRLRSSPV